MGKGTMKSMYSKGAIEILRLVYPHHKETTGDKECDKKCYRCEIERAIREGKTTYETK